MVELIVSKRDTALFRYSLDSGSITIGRSPDNDIYLNSPSVSQQHARISLSEGACSIQNLASKGGIFVNNSETKHTQLYDKDVIQVGHYKIVCSFKSPQKPTPIDSARSITKPEQRNMDRGAGASIQQSDGISKPILAKDDFNRHIDSVNKRHGLPIVDNERKIPPPVEDQLGKQSEADSNEPLANMVSSSSTARPEYPRPTSKEKVPPLHGTGIDVLAGPAQGKRIYFTRDSAALGMKEVTAVVIKSVEDGYVAQAPNETVAVTLNGDAIDDSPVQLDNGDLIAFSNLSARFFVEDSME